MAAAYSEHKSASAPQYAFKSGLTHTYVNYKAIAMTLTLTLTLTLSLPLTR